MGQSWYGMYIALELHRFIPRAQRKQISKRQNQKDFVAVIGHRTSVIARGPESVIPPDREDFPSSLSVRESERKLEIFKNCFFYAENVF